MTTTITVDFPPGARALLFPDGRRRTQSRYLARRWFDDPQRLARFLHLCDLLGVQARVEAGQLPLPLGGTP